MRSNASTFRRFAAVEEQMIRNAMPQTSVADPEPLALAARRLSVVVSNRGLTRLVRVVPTLTFTIAEVANA